MQPLSPTANCHWHDLLDDARLGGKESLEQIANEVRSYLLAVTDARVGDQLRGKFGASDIVQQSLLEASQTFDSFRGNTEAELKGWLKRIVIHNLTDEARKYSNTQSRDASREVAINAKDEWREVTCDRSPTASQVVSRNEQSVQLLQAVHRLPERQREVVESRHRRGRTYQQIAEELGITDNAARNLWTRAMHNLREMLSEDNGQLREQTKTSKPR